MNRSHNADAAIAPPLPMTQRLEPHLKRPGITLIGVLAIALGARLLGIASRPIWYDEAFAVLFSEKGPAAMLHGTLTVSGAGAADVHPLGYYTILWLWMRLFGESLVAVRLLSVLAGLGVVAVVLLLAAELFQPRTAIAAAMLATLAPFQVHFAQEIRMYSFLCLWLLLATYASWRLSRSPGWRWVIAFGLFSALAQYTQNLAAFYLAALAAWPLIARDWQALKRTLIGAGLALLLYLPWLIQLPLQFAKLQNGYWVLRPDLLRLPVLPVIFLVGLPIPAPWLLLAMFLGLAATGIALLRTVQARRERTPDVRLGLWMLYLAFMPALLMFIVSRWQPVYLERALLPSGAAFLIWLAWAMLERQALKPAHAIVGVLVALGFAIGLRVHLTNEGGLYGPYQAITQDLQARSQPGDIIVHANKYSMLPSVFFDRQLHQTYIQDLPGSAADTLALPTQESLGLIAEPNIEAAAQSAPRVWFVTLAGPGQDLEGPAAPQDPNLAWLTQHYSEADERDWVSLRVFLFTRKP